MTAARIGIIGGSGLYAMHGIEVIDSLQIDTPYGPPSDNPVLARFGEREIVFLPRHGSNHHLPPHRINYRANIYAMKLAGVTQLISVSAVGSLRRDIEPGHFVLADQFVDRTQGRDATFFEGPVVAHVPMGDPVCQSLRSALENAGKKAGITTHGAGTYLVMQGPQFSTRAESELYRQWGMDIIGMTNMPEAKLAREAEICYATVAMCTDYDCWHDEEEDVSVDAIIEIMNRNVANAHRLLEHLLAAAPVACECGCQQVLDRSIFADLTRQDDTAIRPIHALVERFL